MIQTALYNTRNAAFNALCWLAIRAAPNNAIHNRGITRSYSHGAFVLKEIPRVIDQRYLKWPTKHPTLFTRLTKKTIQLRDASAATFDRLGCALRRLASKSYETLTRLNGGRIRSPSLSQLIVSLRKA